MRYPTTEARVVVEGVSVYLILTLNVLASRCKHASNRHVICECHVRFCKKHRGEIALG